MAALFAVQLALLAAILAIFWYQDWRFSLPTPRPKDLKQPGIGVNVLATLPVNFRTMLPTGKPVLIHFFNPGCPCSRFNLSHIRDLVRMYYGRGVEFIAVLENEDMNYAMSKFQSFGIAHMRAFSDPKGWLAQGFGVYSTPQAVLLDASGSIYYRGNYNKSRYCLDAQSEYARVAIDDLLANRPAPSFGKDATEAYGCQVPRG